MTESQNPDGNLIRISHKKTTTSKNAKTEHKIYSDEAEIAQLEWKMQLIETNKK